MKEKLAKAKALWLGTILPLAYGAYGADAGATGTNNEGGDLGQMISQQAQSLGQSATQVADATKKWMLVVVIALFLVLVVGGGYGAYYWYTHTKGNPNQGANTTIALIYAVVAAVLGMIVWVLIYSFMKKHNLIP